MAGRSAERAGSSGDVTMGPRTGRFDFELYYASPQDADKRSKVNRVDALDFLTFRSMARIDSILSFGDCEYIDPLVRLDAER